MTRRHYRRDGDDGPVLVTVDDGLADGDGGSDPSADLAALRWSCSISWAGPSDDLARVRDAMDTAVSRLGGRVVATAQGDRTLEVTVRVAERGDAERLGRAVGEAVDGVVVTVSDDPSGDELDRWRPVGIERQSLEDHRVLDELFAAGDTGAPRRIEHVVAVGPLADDERDELRRSLRALGYLLDDADAERWTVGHDSAPVDVTPEAWTIRQVSERVGAEHLGWRCAVVRDRPAARRRWGRRARNGPTG